MKFTKMHGCGNDYVYINGAEERIPGDKKPELVRFLSDRHMGIGGDGVIFINPSDEADFEMEMWNADGTRAEMCGNGIRCVAKYVYDHGMTDRTDISIVSFGSVKHLKLNVTDGKVTTVRVDMGEPVLDPELVPVDLTAVQADKLSYTDSREGMSAVRAYLSAGENEAQYTCVSMGNPHAVAYVDDVYAADVHGIGREIEVHPFFPKKTNVEFIHVIDRSHMDMRVWERGTGETMACGTGTCASVVASILNGLTGNDVLVNLLGGQLEISWEGPGSHVIMTGPATEVFSGNIEYSF